MVRRDDERADHRDLHHYRLATSLAVPFLVRFPNENGPAGLHG
jgi:hypothetical protein